MPLYQYLCDKCYLPYEITMPLKMKDKIDSGKGTKKELDELRCPECGEPMRQVIGMPRLLSSRASYGY